MTKLSDTQRIILSRAAQHEALLATPPAKLPAAARQAVLRSMIAKGLLEEVPAPREAIALGWRQDEDGAWIALRIYAAMAQKERELISERTRAALAAAKARGKVLGGDRGYRPATGPDAATATAARREVAERSAHRLHLEVQRLRKAGIVGHGELARALTARNVRAPRGGAVWTHTTVARLMQRVDRAILHGTAASDRIGLAQSLLHHTQASSGPS